MKFILTIDTEGDNQWDHGRALTVENIRYIPRFQKLCERYLIRPTYLVTSEICEDSYAKKMLKDEGENVGIVDLPAGFYRLVLLYNGNRVERWVEVKSGQLTQAVILTK